MSLNEESMVCMDSGSLTISCWNSRGMASSIPYLLKLMKTNDIIALSEHWLYPNRLHVLNDISEEFSCIARSSRHCRSEHYGKRGFGRGQGGVALLWKTSLNGISPMPEIVHDRVCGIRLQTRYGKVIIFLSVYFPSSRNNYKEFSEELGAIIEDLEEGSSVVILGDFNGDVGNCFGTRSTSQPNKLGMLTGEFFKEYSLSPVNMFDQYATGPVHTFKGNRGNSTIDYIAVTNDIWNLIRRCEVVKDDYDNKSDHYAVSVEIDIDIIPSPSDVDDVTSSAKMAALFMSSSKQVGNASFSCVRDEKMEKLLASTKDKNREDLKKEIIAGFTKSTLLEFRRKLFEVAVKKAESKMEDNNIPWDEIPETQAEYDQKPSSWGLRNRKTRPSIAEDSIELAVFIEDPQRDFPMQIVRALSGKEKTEHATSNDDAEQASSDSNSSSSVFDENLEFIDTQESLRPDVTESNHTTANPSVERFVIRECEADPNASNSEAIPVIVTPLCDSGTSTDDLSLLIPIIDPTQASLRRDYGTSTDGLILRRSEATQTERGMFQEVRDIDTSPDSFNEDHIEYSSVNRSRDKPEQPANNMAYRELQVRCEKAEARLVEIENQHQREITDLRREQAGIRKDLYKISTGAEQPDSQIVEIPDESDFVYTQDTQGDTVVTRASSMHRELAQKEAGARCDYSRDSSIPRRYRMEDQLGNSIAKEMAAAKASQPQPDMPRRTNMSSKTKENSSTTRKSAAANMNTNPGVTLNTNLQIITGNARRWSQKRISTQIDPTTGSDTDQPEQFAKKRRVENPNTASSSIFP